MNAESRGPAQWRGQQNTDGVFLFAIGAPRVVLTRLTAAGLLETVGRGLYRLPDAQVSELESLGIIATKVPQAVFCLLTALQFLTLPRERRMTAASPKIAQSVRARLLNVAKAQGVDPNSVMVEEIRKDTGYGGVRVIIAVDLARARCKTQIDVGFGYVVAKKNGLPPEPLPAVVGRLSVALASALNTAAR